jgi:hypothetical protein
MDHNILNKQKNLQMIEMILILNVQLKVPIGCYEEFNWKNIIWSNLSWLVISVEEIEKNHRLLYILRKKL